MLEKNVYLQPVELFYQPVIFKQSELFKRLIFHLAECGNMLSKLFHYISDLMCIEAQL